MIRKEKGVVKENLKGGNGRVEIFHMLSEDELRGHSKMYAKVVIKPYSSVGWHQHIDDTESYYILDGEGIFVDADGSKARVKSGDICLIDIGQYHSIENDTDKDLVVMALIVNE